MYSVKLETAKLQTLTDRTTTEPRYTYQVTRDDRVFAAGLTYADAHETVRFLTDGPRNVSGWPKYEAELQVQGRRRPERYEFFARDFVAALAYAAKCARDLEMVTERRVLATKVVVARPVPVAA